MSKKRAKAIFWTIIAIVAILEAGFVANKVWAAPRERVQVHSAVVLGDSLIFGSSAQLKAAMDKAGWRNQNLGYPGMPIAIAKVDPAVLATKPLETLLATKPDAFVVALGTNDVRFFDTEGKQATLDSQHVYLESLKAVPCVIWVGVQTDTSQAELDRWGNVLNYELRQGLRSYPNAHFLDWGRLEQQHPEYRHSDGLHFSDAGNQAYADAITNTIQTEC